MLWGRYCNTPVKEVRKMKMSEARRARGHTVRSLAEAVGLSPTTVSGIETGKIENPRYESVVRLSRGLGVAPEDVEEFQPALRAIARERVPEEAEELVETEIMNITGGELFTISGVDPELARAGGRQALRSLMRWLGREETDRMYAKVFGERKS